ncbi:hypothetical protein CesoFtcFv8_007620 [Champsocephalus esox]|uniref:Uncharacterized protein n=2 Tax=Champsocephalus TaxID=52236 RepID=A0AAN8DTP7_CHAGU|nr:hypothetical protein CesoFtcFv8_007620 [Champsocephalus esox]KAK5928124.1 hypothetical protein CgunFtcFv8_013213 [Champsocephalus gunnari]
MSSETSPELPSVLRSVLPSLISSHPAAKHPSTSTVTMSNTEARYSRESEGNCTFIDSKSVSLSSPKAPRISPVRVCDRRGMEGTGQPIESDQHPLRPPIQCTCATSDR